ncbi:MAG: carbohydrate ABC transporter permease [Oscillospiraceae bacterium]|jgi:putative aldouronate transport system permease protein|nr:carbohydrate ABC transporter permease [Oscillospiraceae bacterium]
MRRTRAEKLFNVFNISFLGLTAFICLVPLLNTLAISLSDTLPVNRNQVTLWPVEINLKAYSFLLNNDRFWRAALVSIYRVLLGSLINMVLIVLCAYPLSKEPGKFQFRSLYSWLFVVTMLLNGGLIPTFMLVSGLGLLDTIWSLVLPGAVNVFNMVLMLNFFRGIPAELEEAATIDGAGHFRILWQIYIPCALPAIATVLLLSVVGHWNAWFDGIIYSNKLESYPLQSYLQTIIVGLQMMNNEMSVERYALFSQLNERSIRSAQIIIAMLPVAMVYPFLQRYFVTGIVVGSVKQ